MIIQIAHLTLYWKLFASWNSDAGLGWQRFTDLFRVQDQLQSPQSMKKITIKLALCCICMIHTYCTGDTYCVYCTSEGYDPADGLWTSHIGSPTPKQSSWKWKAIWGFTYL